MYAVVVKVRVDAGRIQEAQASLQTDVLPRVQQAPGVTAGYWLAPVNGGEGMSLVFIDDREKAERLAGTIPAQPAPGVELESTEVREVIARF